MVDSLGTVNDAVTLSLGGNALIKVHSYEFAQSILDQPSAFSLKVGDGSLARYFGVTYPPRTPCELKIGGALRATGFTDAIQLEDGGGATEVTIRGRDNLADLHDAYVTAEVSFTNLTFADLVQKALDSAGYGTTVVKYTNEANRKILSGVSVSQTKAPRDASAKTSGSVQKALQVKLGERWWDFLKRVLATQGFFLWCAADGTFLLSEPNGNQAPTYRIKRERGALRNAVNVVHASFSNDTVNRFSEAIIYARGGGRKFGRQKAKGAFVDDEMVSLGYTRPYVAKDVNVTNADQAEFYARRKLAETRRDGFRLEYTVSGHTVPSLVGGNAVWTPDTIVDVQDDEFGIHESMYLEGVIFRRDESGGTTTQLRLQRPADLIFATHEAPGE